MALVSKTGSYSLVGAPPQPSRDSDGLRLVLQTPGKPLNLWEAAILLQCFFPLSVSHLPCTALLIVPREHGTTARKPTLCVGASKQGQVPGGQLSLQPPWMWSVCLFPHSGPARRPWGEPGPGGSAGLSWTHCWAKAELGLEPRAVGWGGALPHTPHPGLLPPAPGGQPPLTEFIHVHLLTVTVKRSDCPLESNS